MLFQNSLLYARNFISPQNVNEFTVRNQFHQFRFQQTSGRIKSADYQLIKLNQLTIQHRYCSVRNREGPSTKWKRVNGLIK